MNILDAILSHKRKEVAAGMRQTPLADMHQRAIAQKPPRPFVGALTGAGADGRFPVIAEIKRKSPSKGLLCETFDPAAIATTYKDGKAACLSVLTDEKFFGGSADDLNAASASGLPILRKDFMLNEWQIAESRALGADAILLIAAALPDETLPALARTAADYGMAVLVETHNAAEVKIALTLPDVLIGINNRDLKTFHTDLQTTLDLLPLAGGKGHLVVSESGIHHREDILRLQEAGADAYLIGESLMREPGAVLRRLFSSAPIRETG